MGVLLKTGWFKPSSVEETVRNLIASFDNNYLRTVSSAASFERDLIKEIRFVSAYRGDEEKSVLEYIHTHADELYQFAKSAVSKKVSEK
jgi:hypothetical protein